MISAWLSGGTYYLKSSWYVDQEGYSIKSLWLNFDKCIGLHEAVDFPLIPFDKSRRACWHYISRACRVVGRDEGRPGWALNATDAAKVTAALGPPPFSRYSIYMITISNPENKEEVPVYFGQTNSKNHCFKGGHRAISKLHAPQYEGKLKRIYFGCVSAVNDDDHIFPVEWINPLGLRKVLLSSVEYQLIYDLQSELNDKGKDKCFVVKSMPIVIQNMARTLLDGQSFGPAEAEDDEES